MNNSNKQQIEYKQISYSPKMALQYFSPIEDQPWAMLLKSTSTTHMDSRFDILVADPVATLTTTGQITVVNEGIREKTDTWQSTRDPFHLLAELQNKWTPSVSSPATLPFVGGALGYFAYDLGRRIEQIPTTAKHDINLPEMAVGLYTWALIVDHYEKRAYWVGQELAAAECWFNKQLMQHDQFIQPDKFRPQYKPSPEHFRLTSPWHSNMTPEMYRQKFNAIQNYLRAGDCYQINLTQRFQASYEGSEWLAFQTLDAENQAPFSAYLRTEAGVILSVSPERFLQVRTHTIEAKPIKGTRPRSLDPAEDNAHAQALLHAEKDQAENLMIVDLLRNDIGRVARPGSVHVPKLFEIETFPSVHHLVSTIRAELDHHYTSADLLRACFPGGSITGAPKIRAMEIIEELEPHRRSVYCGSIGYISRDGQMDTSITIRTLIATGQMLYAWAGGGIVADSVCEHEYQETLDKLSRILPVLTSADLSSTAVSSTTHVTATSDVG